MSRSDMIHGYNLIGPARAEAAAPGTVELPSSRKHTMILGPSDDLPGPVEHQQNVTVHVLNFSSRSQDFRRPSRARLASEESGLLTMDELGPIRLKPGKFNRV
eukprot:758342-Hanusia_phi.AAC.2